METLMQEAGIRTIQVLQLVNIGIEIAEEVTEVKPPEISDIPLKSDPEETNDEDIDTAEPLEPPRNSTNVVIPTDKELGFCKENDDCVDASFCCSNLSCVDPSICLHGKKLQQDVCSFDFECMSRCCFNNTCLHFLNCYKNCSSNADCTNE